MAHANRCQSCGRITGSRNAKDASQRMCTDPRCADLKRTNPAPDKLPGHEQSVHSKNPPLVRRISLPRDGELTAANAMQAQVRLLAAAEKKAIEDTFWSCYVPSAGQNQRLPSATVLRVFPEAQAPYEQLREITYSSSLVERCARACVFACLGRLHQDRRLNMRGAQMYSAVLRQASAMVAHPAAANVDDLLACCLAMCNYEALRDDTEPGSWYFPTWHEHVKGLCQALRTRGQSAHPSASVQYAWHEARLKAARSAMFLRQPVFTLERQPRSASEAGSLALYDDMLDSIFAVSQWFPQIDRLTQRADESQLALLGPAAVKTAVRRGLHIAETLVKWEKRAVTQYCDSEQPTLFSLCSTANGELFNLLTHYWMVCMLLQSQLPLFVARFSLWYPDLTLPSWVDGWPHAVCITRVGPLACHPSLGLWSAQQAIAPMIATVFFFAGSGIWHTPECQSLRSYVEDENRVGNALIRRWFRGMFAHVKPTPSDIIPQAEMVAMAQKWYGLRDNMQLNAYDGA